MYDFCDRHGLAYARIGKVIVATERDELGRLEELERRARANGVVGVRRIGADELREIEPHCVGVAPLHSPNTGIVDFGAVARALAEDIRGRGAEVRLGSEVRKVERRNRATVLTTSTGQIEGNTAVFCAGLWSDRLAVAAGSPTDPRIVPFRGGYLTLKSSARHLVRSLIYPVSDPDLPFLGVHLTRHITGDVWLGPTALLVAARDAYRLSRVRGRDLVETLTWPGTWRVAWRFRATAWSEVRMAASTRAFVAACARYVPELRLEDVSGSSHAGVRAQAVSRRGDLIDDFVFLKRPEHCTFATLQAPLRRPRSASRR